MEEQPQENIVADYYNNYNEVQEQVMAVELKKTRNRLLAIAIIVFLSDLLVLFTSGLVTPVTIGIILVIPIILTGLSFLSLKEPVAAMTIATIIFLAVWIFMVIRLGRTAIIQGAIGKIIIIVMLIAGFQNAREAARIKREIRR